MEDVLGPQFVQSGFCKSMQTWIFQDFPRMDMVDLSGFPHVEMVQQICVFLSKDVNCGK